MTRPKLGGPFNLWVGSTRPNILGTTDTHTERGHPFMQNVSCKKNTTGLYVPHASSHKWKLQTFYFHAKYSQCKNTIGNKRFQPREKTPHLLTSWPENWEKTRPLSAHYVAQVSTKHQKQNLEMTIFKYCFAGNSYIST